MNTYYSNIDAVICWVDSGDPKHRQKLASYRNVQFGDTTAPDDIAGDTRFKSENEIYCCLGSILRHAPFIRKIFIVTDNQQPDLDTFLAENFPENRTPIEIVDHTTIFKGYEEYLPVFNSLSIETFLYRIPGLSERFVYFNDDMSLIRPATPETWFDDKGRTVAYGTFMDSRLLNLLRKIKPSKNGHKTFGFKDSMINGLPLIGVKGKFFGLGHTPYALTKSFFESFYSEHPEYALINIRHKFRDPSQFNPQCLYYNAMLKEGKCITKDYRKFTICIKPCSCSIKHLKHKLDMYDKNKDLKFFCVNSLDQAEKPIRDYVLTWLQNATGSFISEIKTK